MCFKIWDLLNLKIHSMNKTSRELNYSIKSLGFQNQVSLTGFHNINYYKIMNYSTNILFCFPWEGQCYVTAMNFSFTSKCLQLPPTLNSVLFHDPIQFFFSKCFCIFFSVFVHIANRLNILGYFHRAKFFPFSKLCYCLIMY